VTLASCQKFYDEMTDKYNLPKIEVINKFNVNNLEQTTNEFEKGMAKWKKLYLKSKINVKNYHNLEEFRKDYLA
jgi:hypothetical protein